jgi:YVTN family beta-propeller protein
MSQSCSIVRVVVAAVVVTLCAVTGVAQTIVSEVPGSPFAAGSFPESLRVTPDGAYLYVANSTSDDVSGFAIATTGVLSAVPGSPFTGTGWGPIGLDTGAGWVITVEGSGLNRVRVLDIGGGGGLSEVAGSPFATGGAASQNVAVAPSGSFVVVTNASSDNVSVLTLAGDGSLAAIAGSPFGGGDEPQGLAISADSQRLFVCNCLGDNVSAFTLAANGTPSAVAGSPFASGDCPLVAAIHPSGNSLYVGTTNSGLLGFSVAGNGALAQLPGSPFIPGPGGYAQDIAMSSEGGRLFVAWHGGSTDELRVFAVQAGGGLIEEPFSPYTLPRQPGGIAVHPNGRFVYLTDLVDDSVTALELRYAGPVPALGGVGLGALLVLLAAAGTVALVRRGSLVG